MHFTCKALYAAASVLAFVVAVVSVDSEPLPKGKGSADNSYPPGKTSYSKTDGKDGPKISKYKLGLCEPMPPPKNGAISCSSTARRMICSASCPEGFEFPDKSILKKNTCNNNEGKWLDVKISDCQPICNPDCMNGGQCMGRNRCVCTPEYRGETCQFSVTICDGGKFHETGGYQCNHTSDESRCALSCPSGMEFVYPPAAVYTCDITGNWLPKYAPKCILSQLIVHTLSPTLSTVEPELKLMELKELKPGVCSTWGQLHYRTFDGVLYNAQGKCTYLLAKDCASNTFNIHVRNDLKCNNMLDCYSEVIIYINHEKYTLVNSGNRPEVYWGTNRITIPTTINGLLLEEVAHYIVVRSEIGFTLRWNGKDSISLEVSTKLLNRTCGLCGRYDGDASNDISKIDGFVTDNIESFVNSWKMNNFDDNCPDSTKLEDACAYNNPEKKQISDEASEFCRQIFLNEYSSCHALIEPEPYYKMCRLDFCSCGLDDDTCMCSSLAKYFQECHRLGGRLAYGWRKPNFCPFKCSGDMQYADCGSSCPATCKKALDDCSDEQCIDGCHCPEGTVLLGDRCIKSTDCPCHHAGKTYENGKSIQRDCNTCKCDGGVWKCTTQRCASRCSAIGDPHYTTFDGKHFNFMGKCSYYLISANDYSIEQENVACSGALSEKMNFAISESSNYPSCTKSLTIRIRGTVLRLKQRKEVILNGKDVYELPFSAPGVYVYEASSMFIMVVLDNNLTVSWDGISRVYVDAPLSFLDNTKGLCGTFNYNRKDDFLTNEGDVEPNVNAFANKWKVSDTCQDIAVGESLRDPCQLFSQRQQKSEALCGRLKSDIFAACHDVVDPEPYYKNCIYDMCYCQNRIMECLCPAISDYAAECTKKDIIIDWRSSVRECGVNCPGGQVYQICGSSCMRSCVDISYHPNCHEQCIEGCNCPHGTTLNHQGECIPISTCPCKHGGRDYAPGHKDLRGDLTCECTNARWNCRTATMDEIKESNAYNETKPICSAAANMEYTDCASDCPLTCKNMHSPPKCDSPICKHGCRCLKGYVLDTKSSSCVKITQCPCHHGGQSYSEGETIKEDCNTCVCEGGNWNCEKSECPGICSAWGESHFKTFDGQMFEFHGDCDYVLARSSGDVNWAKFQVTIHNVLCGTSDVTCSKSLTINIDDEKITLDSERPLTTVKFGSRYTLREVGLSVFVHTNIGISLQWDRYTRVYVKADQRWKDKIEGLCGNFNDDENDDFKTSDGGPPVGMATMFGDSWRIHNYCPVSKIIENTCDLHPHRKSWAAEKCSVLKSSLFKRCHSEVPYEPYLERCVFDSCGCDIGGDCDCFCTAVAAYAQECTGHGIPIAWRSEELCPIQCDHRSKYVPCLSVCPQLTCETQYLYSDVEETCGPEICVEGCQPPPCQNPNDIYNNDREFRCIPKSSCVDQPCRVINGRVYHEGEKVKDPDVADPCQSCHCRTGDITCVGKKCASTTVSPQPTEIVSPRSPEHLLPAAPICVDGWTDWMNSFSPTYKNNGDYETLENLQKKRYTVCPTEKVQAIECRTVGTHKYYNETGQDITCSLPKGLICENKNQPVIKLCNDFEIRLQCQCDSKNPFGTNVGARPPPIQEEQSTTTETTTTITMTSSTTTERTVINPPVKCDNVDKAVDGWTSWMNANSPAINYDGDMETRDILRTKYSFCADEYVTNIECREVGTNLSFSIAGEYGVVCDLNHGLKCLNSMQPSGRCKDYEVRLYCLFNCVKKSFIPHGPTTSTTSSLPYSTEKTPLICDGWTEWLNNDSPEDDGSDREELSLVPNFATICETPKSYQCRNARTKEPFGVTAMQQNIIEPCNYKGIVCENGDTFEACDDYEIRVFCTCHAPVCTEKWTDWFDTDDPNKGEGDFEQIETISQTYSTCGSQPVTNIQCQARKNSGGPKKPGNRSETSIKPTGSYVNGSAELDNWVDYTKSGDVGVKCNTLNGLTCYNTFQTKGRRCRDYRVRFYCSCEGVTTTLPPLPGLLQPATTKGWGDVTTTTIRTTTITTTTSLCMPGMVWSDCAYPCDQMCQSFHHQSIKGNFCSRGGNKTCIAGCIERECLPPYVWRDESTCVRADECTCLINDFQLIPPGDIVIIDRCQRCQCIANALDCTVTKECLPSMGNLTYEISSTPSIPPVPIPIEQDDCWTSWVNIDSPNATASDVGDLEDLSAIRALFSFCAQPIAIDCRVAKTYQSYVETGQIVDCNRHTGLVCWNQRNWETSGCYDYEVRFYCPCNATTTIEPGVTGSSSPPGEEFCVEGPTSWFSSHVPDIYGTEYENIQDIREAGNRFCANEDITAIVCRVKGTDIPYFKSNDSIVTCNIREGLSCDGRLQNHPCLDYEVQFYCQCKSSTTTRTTTPAPTTQSATPTPTTARITSVTMMTVLPACSYWSEWINNDKPFVGIGDIEILKPPTTFCKEGSIQDIECVRENDNVPYTEAQQLNVKCSLKMGFVCKNKYQTNKLCHDYKIRWYCACANQTVEEVSTRATPTSGTTIVVVPPPSTSPSTQLPSCVSYVYLINGDKPVSDSSLQASGSLNSAYGPQNCRITNNNSMSSTAGGAWIAAEKSVGQYIQVDLGTPHLVYGIVTEGNPRSPSWVTSYNVLYSVDGSSFSYVSELDNSIVSFKGNYDRTTVVRNLFRSPIEARFVRVLPLTWEGAISLRFDVLGCSQFAATSTYTPTSASTPTYTPMMTTTSAIVCNDIMGLENGMISDEQLKSTSNYDVDHGPDKARLNGLGNWSPKNLDKFQFVQIDFNEIRLISGVATQGRPDVSQWVTSYYVSYSTYGVTWSNVTDDTWQTEVFAGNYDGQSVVTNHFDKVVRARFLRIVPQTWHNYIALRAEVIGCPEAGETTATMTTTSMLAPSTTTVSAKQCDDPMGMENGQIHPEMIKVSSSLYTYGKQKTDGDQARLNAKETESLSSGWLASNNTEDQYLIVDFMDLSNVSGIMTQGREKHGEWVKKYKVLYSGDDKQWYEAKDENGNVIFAGNTDDEGVVTHMFEKTYSARLVKIIPIEWKNWISLRLEIIGCYEGQYPVLPPQLTFCQDSLNWNIPWDQMEVSSTQSGPRSGTRRLALNTLEKEETGGWVAGESDKRQFVIIDYGQPVQISGVVTQGRNKYPEWVTKYHVFTSPDKIKWMAAIDRDTNDDTIIGNFDSDTPQKRFFKQIMIARYFKLVPYEWKDWISMRLDVLGCPITPRNRTEPSETCRGSLNADIVKPTSNQMKVSSSRDGSRSGTDRLALNTPDGQDTGGWVAAQAEAGEYIVIDYQEPVTITGIVTQGRNGHPEWVSEYRVYTSQDATDWSVAADQTGNTLISGNADSDTQVTHFFERPMQARYFKLVPYQWNRWISMRLDVLGCKQNITSTTAFPPSSTTSLPPPSTTNYCYQYGPWLSLTTPSAAWAYTDYEPINELINGSKLCTNPIQIECRETTSKKAYDQMGQQVSCDLTKGLECKTDLRIGSYEPPHCYNYEARIVCWTCGVTLLPTGRPTLVVAPPTCPELTLYGATSCPESCQLGLVCDGRDCVDPSFCPCVQNGKFYAPGERFTNADCEECVCKLNGHSYCVQRACPPCPYGQPGNLTLTAGGRCECECKQCADGELLCKTNLYCLRKDLWCDGVVDCPDDEKECPTSSPSQSATPPTPTTAYWQPSTCPPNYAPTCAPGYSLVLKDPAASCPTYVCASIKPTQPPPPPPPKKDLCEMSASYFKTFDGYDYKYEICDHVLLRDSADESKLKVTLVRRCSSDTGQCARRLNFTQDDHVVLVDEHLSVSFDGTVYTDAQLIKIGRKNLGLTVRLIADSAVIKSTLNRYFGLEVHFNIDQNVRIGVLPDSMLNKVTGLCGRYSGSADDDLERPDGKQALTVTEFGDSWGSRNREHCESKACPADLMAKAIAACNQLKSAPFDECHQFVDPSYPIQTCADSVCECVTNTNFTEKECHCKAFLPYVEACEMKGLAKIRYWRLKQSCLPDCAPGLVWLDCGSECERTCDTLQDDHEVFQQTEDGAFELVTASSSCDSSQCVPGCFCPVGLVRKGDHCVEPAKCQDCVCKGYGDPHYFTFDGRYFPFQGNCTYILAQDILAPGQDHHNFNVYATNEDCHEEPLTTCTVEIILFFDGHMAHFRVNASVTFDGIQLFYSDFPFHRYGIHIESIPGRSITFSVPEIRLEVRFYELNYGFEVRIPSDIYYNKTEGLCGNCNFDENDDFRCPNEKIANDTDEFGFSWIAKPPEGFESVAEICTLKELKPSCKPTIDERLCDRILADDFSRCHGLVDPQVYISACRFDICHSVSPMASMCRTVAEYARKCVGQGVCVQNWRKKDFCDYECPGGMYYDQCGPACPKSCKDVHNGWALDARSHGKDVVGGEFLAELEEEDFQHYQQKQTQELVDVCDTDPVDGCFCIGGKVFHNGTCVDEIFCEICDDKGHKVGDTWRTDSCTTCKCSMTQTIECVKTMCPAKPICKDGESLKVLKASNNTCCDTHECVTNPAKTTCPEADLPSCKKGEVIRAKTNEEGCPHYVCECDVSECPPVHTPTQLELGEETAIDKSGCCQVLKVVCREEKCPKKPTCDKDRQLRERTDSKSRCCKEYYCEDPPNVCLYAHEYKVVAGKEIKIKPGNQVNEYYKPGDVWTDGFCRRCSCAMEKDKPTYRCSIELCPQLSDYQDKDEYEWHTELPDGACCPKFTRRACLDVKGNKYNIGDEWESPDGDKCKSYRCGTADNSDAIRVQRTVKCIRKCPIGFEYVESKSNATQCCGKCEPVGCVEDGELHNVGSVWNSTTQQCTTAECIKLQGTIKTRYNSKVCQPVPQGCSEKIKDEDGCCDICNGTITYSSLQACVPKKVSPNQTEGIFELFHAGIQCQNHKPILDMMACVGNCESTSIYSAGKHDFMSFCHCCAPKSTIKKTIWLDCTDGVERPIDYYQPTDCTCSPCGSNFNQTAGVQLNTIF